MSKHRNGLLAVLVLVLLAGCGEIPTVPPLPEPTTGAVLPPPAAPASYPTVEVMPTLEPTPEPAFPSPSPIPLVVQPTPYAPLEPLPPGFPSVVYAVRRSSDPVQLWTLRYDQGLLQEELWINLTPDLLEAQLGGHWSLGLMPVHRLSPSPDGRYVALILGPQSGFGSHTLVVGKDSKVSVPMVMPTGRGVGLLAWIPGSDRIFVGDSDGNVWGTVRADGTDFVQFPGQYVLRGVLDAVASPDGKEVIFSEIPIDDIWLGSVEVSSGSLTSFSLPEPLLFTGKDKGYLRNLALSPDGRTCAFTKEHSVTDQGGGQIWLMGADGLDFRPLGPDNTYDYGLAWSPDGKTIVFSRWDPYPSILVPPAEPTVLTGSLRLIDVETGQERMLQSSEGQYAHWSPRWLPDGSGLVFLSTRGGEANLWFIRSDGTGLQQLTYQGGLTGEIALQDR